MTSHCLTTWAIKEGKNMSPLQLKCSIITLLDYYKSSIRVLQQSCSPALNKFIRELKQNKQGSLTLLIVTAMFI